MINYLQKYKKTIPVGLLSGGLGFAAGSMGLLGTMLFPIAPVAVLSSAITGCTASLLNNDNGKLQDKDVNSKEIFDLKVGSLEDQIEAIQYSIQALELKKDELSIEDKQKILISKAQIKLLERQIKELKMQNELK